MSGATRYDEIADHYVEVVGDAVSDSPAAALLELVGDPHGLRVFDLACGQGRVSRELARRGASVVGVDISARLLEKARAAEAKEPLAIDYVLADATAPDALAGETFDGAVCHFGLSDIDDFGGAMATVARVLRSGGWFVFSIVHPCFPGVGEAPSSWPPGRGYYTEGWWLAESPGFRGKVGANHRTLSTYLNDLVEHGLTLERVAEPLPDDDWVSSKPSHDPVPLYLVVRARKT